MMEPSRDVLRLQEHGNVVGAPRRDRADQPGELCGQTHQVIHADAVQQAAPVLDVHELPLPPLRHNPSARHPVVVLRPAEAHLLHLYDLTPQLRDIPQVQVGAGLNRGGSPVDGLRLDLDARLTGAGVDNMDVGFHPDAR